MKHPVARALLIVAGLLVVALAMNLFAGPTRGLALSSAGLMGLLVYRVMRARHEHVPHALPECLPDHTAQAPWLEPQLALTQDSGSRVNAASGQSCGTTVLDRDYRILWSSEVSGMHLGIQAKSDIGQPIGHVFRGSPVAAYVAAGDYSKPLRLRAAQLKGRIVSMWLVPYLDSQWLLLSLDVTEAIEHETARRDCVADALHELSSPITVLAGYLDAMRGPAPGSRRLRECLDSMEVQCRRLKRSVENLLKLSALESAPQPPSDERIDSRVLFAAIRDEAEALSAGRHRIVMDAGPELDLFGCGSEIASAFNNLASNAIRYTPDGGEIRLAWRALPDGGAEFIVEDTGIGIAKEDIPRLTERFFRVNHEHSRKIAGTGLGLAIVKDVLTRHQAALEIESEPGVGSRFKAVFPPRRVMMPAAVQNVFPISSGKATQASPLSSAKNQGKNARGRRVAREIRSAPSRAYGRVFISATGKPRHGL